LKGAKIMSNKNLRRTAHEFKKEKRVWWYEETKGIRLVVNFGKGTVCQPIIPWKTIRAALARKDKKGSD
jgi:hypothetical protein